MQNAKTERANFIAIKVCQAQHFLYIFKNLKNLNKIDYKDKLNQLNPSSCQKFVLRGQSRCEFSFCMKRMQGF